MTKEEHYKKAKELISKNLEKGKSYIRGSLTVKASGELSDRLRALLHGNIEETQTQTARQTQSKGKTRKTTNVGKAKSRPKQS